MKYDLLLHLVGWNADPDDEEAIGKGVRLSKTIELPNVPCVEMSLQIVDYTEGEVRRNIDSAEDVASLSKIFDIEELLFHVQQSQVVTVFLCADWSVFGQKYDYLSHTERIYVQNLSGEQRVITAWANIQTPLIPPLGARLRFSEMERCFEINDENKSKSLSPFNEERVVTRVFYSDVNLGELGGHVHTGIESEMLYEVEVENFEAEVARVSQALTRKPGFQISVETV